MCDLSLKAQMVAELYQSLAKGGRLPPEFYRTQEFGPAGSDGTRTGELRSEPLDSAA